MRRPKVLGATLLLSVLPTVLAVWLGYALAGPTGPPHPPTLGDNDRGQEVLDAFETQHVHVLEDAREWITPEQEAQLEEAAANATWPTYVVVGLFSYMAGLPSLHTSASALGWDRGERAIYLIWQGPDSGLIWEHGLRSSLSPSFTGDPTRHLLEMMAELEADPPTVWDRKPDGGHGFGAFLGIVIGLPAAGIAAAVTGFVMRRARRARHG